MKKYRITATIWPKNQRKRYVTVIVKAPSYEAAEAKIHKKVDAMILDVEELD